ncbi:MAG TPA: PEP-CTERM sorting domain-containing protein [Pirellulaceae bacterium]|nr:PEP-CTERM sorting domain-containing protein [Pirellulaceae bacterium]
MKKFIVVAIAVGAFVLQSATTQAYPTTLYTTADDFTGNNNGAGWSGNTITPSTAWDFDGSTINGTANASAGGAGTAGSLAITPLGNWSTTGGTWTGLGELYVGNFLSARLTLDPGYNPGPPEAIFPAASGTITMVWTLPDNGGGGLGTYYEPMLGFNAAWGWTMGGPSSTVSLGVVGGLETFRSTWNYTIPQTTNAWGVNLQFGANTDYNPVDIFYIDEIVVTTATAVPEPAAAALLGLGALTALMVARSKRSEV